MELKYKSIIESILFVWPSPISAEKLASTLEIPVKAVKESVRSLMDDYETRSAGMFIVELDGSYQMCLVPKNNEYVEKLLGSSKNKGLSDSTMEVLAIIAYQQPVTKGDIEEVRGAGCDKQVSALLERSLIEEKGKAERPGKPTLYGTTRSFLRSFNLRSIKDLPKID
jgi:segregation and condensation protein B